MNSGNHPWLKDQVRGSRTGPKLAQRPYSVDLVKERQGQQEGRSPEAFQTDWQEEGQKEERAVEKRKDTDTHIYAEGEGIL